jgi:hypothetical protein
VTSGGNSGSLIPNGLGKLFSMTGDPFLVAELPSIFVIAHNVRDPGGTILAIDRIDISIDRAWLALLSVV